MAGSSHSEAGLFAAAVDKTRQLEVEEAMTALTVSEVRLVTDRDLITVRMFRRTA